METKTLTEQNKRNLSGTALNSAFKQGLLYSEPVMRHAINADEYDQVQYGGTPGRNPRPVQEEQAYAAPNAVAYENEFE